MQVRGIEDQAGHEESGGYARGRGNGGDFERSFEMRINCPKGEIK